MGRLVAAINMTLDGFCNHTAITPSDEVFQHYTELMRNAGAIVFGRTTYQLMESYWPAFVKNPSGDKQDDEFALLLDNMSKIVFSRTLKSVSWKNSILKSGGFQEEILSLKHQPGKDILVGSPGLIADATQLGLVDEFQLCVHPVILGSGLPLFRNIHERIVLKLTKAKTFAGGAVILWYEPAPARAPA